MEKKLETIIMGDMGTTTRIHSFIPSQPKASFLLEADASMTHVSDTCSGKVASS